MSKKDISILVVDRTFGDEDAFKDPVVALRDEGYDVDLRKFLEPFCEYDLVIAHPPWGSFGECVSYHKKSPETKLIFHSGLNGVYRKMVNEDKGAPSLSREDGEKFSKDIDGVYYSVVKPGPEDFVELVNEIFKDRI